MNPYNNDRFFPAGAFLIGALTGGVATAAFNPYRPRPYYPVNNQISYPYPVAYGYNYHQYPYRPY